MELINGPSEIDACGALPKTIQEFVGPVNTGHSNVSIARMKSTRGWEEPGQTPEFDEYTVVLKGTLCVKTSRGSYEVKAGQAIIAHEGEWVQYSTPYEGGAEYIAVCLPAFSPETVHRDDDTR